MNLSHHDHKEYASHAFSSCAQVLHLDPISGVAGDMFVAALVDVGVDEQWVCNAIQNVLSHGYELRFSRRSKHAISAKSFNVWVQENQPERDYYEIKQLLEESSLDARTKYFAHFAFQKLAEAEAKIHNQPIDHVHFHEVGGVDSIADIVGASAAIAWLEEHAGGPEKLGFSIHSLPISSGRTQAAHGSLPLPAPATLELLSGLPIYDARLPQGEEVELITPTGAALVQAFSKTLPFAIGWPSMIATRVGYGAGQRELHDRPNLVRLVLGVPSSNKSLVAIEPSSHILCETNLDDTTGEILASTMEALFSIGALDVWVQPMTMKKNRPAFLLSALALASKKEEIAKTMLAHSGSLGVRWHSVARIERPRRWVSVDTKYGSIPIKVADEDTLSQVIHPEFEACREHALQHNVPVREVIRAAIQAYASV